MPSISDAGGEDRDERSGAGASGGFWTFVRAHAGSLAATLPRPAGGVRKLKFDEPFIRLWEFYLAYCEGGFRERSIGVAHLLFAKPGFRGAAPYAGDAG